jgi:hypothetical protein
LRSRNLIDRDRNFTNGPPKPPHLTVEPHAARTARRLAQRRGESTLQVLAHAEKLGQARGVPRITSDVVLGRKWRFKK